MDSILGKTSAAILAALALAGSSVVLADQVILDDLIVGSSICVGFDCVNGESFGFDTLRLKENNLRIKFQDTSNSASFPSNDWQITANDSSNGGANKFSIDDIDGGRTPFTIEASAPSHSLYVENDGDVGFGTSAPVVNLHVVDGNTPTLRLEQNGSSGFAPQTWDVAGNESNFFVRDATNGSALPFRIEPGSAQNLLYLDSEDRVGINTSAPSTDLHVRGTDGTTSVLIQEANTTQASRLLLSLTNKGNSELSLQSTATFGGQWTTSGGVYYVIYNGDNSGDRAFQISHLNDVIVLDSGGSQVSLQKLITEVESLCSGCSLAP